MYTCVVIFEVRSHCVDQAASDSQRFAWLCLLSAGIKSVCATLPSKELPPIQPFGAIIPSTDWIEPNHVRETNLLFGVYLEFTLSRSTDTQL